MTCASYVSSDPRARACPPPPAWEGAAAQYDAIAELYDGYPGNYLEDLLFFVEEARAVAPGPVLELGVGTGRLALCLAAVGIHVVGIDNSVPMLRRLARKHAAAGKLPGQVRVVAADMRGFALRQRFPLALVPFRTFLCLLTRTAQRRALRCIRRHLSPGGRLVMAFFVPPRELIARGCTEPAEMTRFPSPEGRAQVIAHDWTQFLPARQRVISHIAYQWQRPDGRPLRTINHTLVARYAFPEEMPPLLESCGYRVVQTYGGFRREPLTSESREQIWIAERWRS
jgi:SAM-dependent methyltransferase